MTKPHILQVGPYPEWDQGPLDAAFHMHRYFEIADKAAFLAEVGPQVRGIATRGRVGGRCRDDCGMPTVGGDQRIRRWI